MLRTIFRVMLPLLLIFAFPILGIKGLENQVQAQCGSTPAAPTNLQADQINTNSIEISWNAAPSANHYKVYVTDMTNGNPLPTQSGIGFAATIPGTTVGHTYKIEVTVANGPNCPESPKTTLIVNIVIVVEKIAGRSCNPGAPTGVAAGATNNYCVKLFSTETDKHAGRFITTLKIPNSGIVPCTLNLVMNYSYTISPAGQLAQSATAKLNVNQNQSQSSLPSGTVHFVPDGEVENPYIRVYYQQNEQSPEIPLLEVRHGILATPTSTLAQITFMRDGSYSTCYSSPCGPSIVPGGGNDDRSVDLDLDTEILPHPNPFSSFVAFQYEVDDREVVGIQVFDARGSLVETVQESIAQAAGTYTAQLNGSDLPAGIYFGVIVRDGVKKVYPLMKQ